MQKRIDEYRDFKTKNDLKNKLAEMRKQGFWADKMDAA